LVDPGEGIGADYGGGIILVIDYYYSTVFDSQQRRGEDVVGIGILAIIADCYHSPVEPPSSSS